LTGGNRHDAAVAEPLILSGDTDADFFIGDKGYDSQDLRAAAEDAGMTPVIPSREGARAPADYDRELYKERNLIERAFCFLKDYRRIATRYDKLKRNFEAAVALVAVRMWFLI
jgi:transposase